MFCPLSSLRPARWGAFDYGDIRVRRRHRAVERQRTGWLSDGRIDVRIGSAHGRVCRTAEPRRRFDARCPRRCSISCCAGGSFSKRKCYVFAGQRRWLIEQALARAGGQRGCSRRPILLAYRGVISIDPDLRLPGNLFLRNFGVDRFRIAASRGGSNRATMHSDQTSDFSAKPRGLAAYDRNITSMRLGRHWPWSGLNPHLSVGTNLELRRSRPTCRPDRAFDRHGRPYYPRPGWRGYQHPAPNCVDRSSHSPWARCWRCARP